MHRADGNEQLVHDPRQGQLVPLVGPNGIPVGGDHGQLGDPWHPRAFDQIRRLQIEEHERVDFLVQTLTQVRHCHSATLENSPERVFAPLRTENDNSVEGGARLFLWLFSTCRLEISSYVATTTIHEGAHQPEANLA